MGAITVIFCDYLRAPENAYLHKDCILCKKLSIMPMCMFGCMCTCMQVPRRLEEGLRFPGAGVGGYKIPYVGARSWTQVLSENSIRLHYDTDSFFFNDISIFMLCVWLSCLQVCLASPVYTGHMEVGEGIGSAWNVLMTVVSHSVGARNCTSALLRAARAFHCCTISPALPWLLIEGLPSLFKRFHLIHATVLWLLTLQTVPAESHFCTSLCPS